MIPMRKNSSEAIWTQPYSARTAEILINLRNQPPPGRMRRRQNKMRNYSKKWHSENKFLMAQFQFTRILTSFNQDLTMDLTPSLNTKTRDHPDHKDGVQLMREIMALKIKRKRSKMLR
jgi:hypothetical protein